MGQVATSPVDPLYGLLGVDAEILIDHAWGVEPVTMADIKAYRSQSHSLSNAQVLGCDRDFGGGRIIASEMADSLALELVDQRLVASSVSLYVGYALTREEREAMGDLSSTRAWRSSPSDGGVERLVSPTNSREAILAAAMRLYDSNVRRGRMVHRLGLTLGDVIHEDAPGIQPDLFADPDRLADERRRQEAISAVKKKFGKNAVIKGMNLEEGATTISRNKQIGGHKA